MVSSQDVLSAFTIYDLKKIPTLKSSEYQHNDENLDILISYYGVARTADNLEVRNTLNQLLYQLSTLNRRLSHITTLKNQRKI